MAEASVETVKDLTADISGETTKPLNAEAPMEVVETVKDLTADVSGETTEPLNAEAPKEVVETPAEDINPLLQPTNKTADEIVAEIFAEVSDEGVRNSLERMGKLEDELQTKIEKMQSTFEEYMTSIQQDIDKYWAIDKEYEQYHVKIDELCADDGEKPASQQIKEMVNAFKEGNFKGGLEKFTAGDEVKTSETTNNLTDQAKAIDSTVATDNPTDQVNGIDSTVATNNLTDQVNGIDSIVATNNPTDQFNGNDSSVITNNPTDQNNADVSGEEVFEDAPSEIIAPAANVVANTDKQKVSSDQVKGKGLRTKKHSEDNKSKNDESKVKKSPKKKSMKN